MCLDVVRLVHFEGTYKAFITMILPKPRSLWCVQWFVPSITTLRAGCSVNLKTIQ